METCPREKEDPRKTGHGPARGSQPIEFNPSTPMNHESTPDSDLPSAKDASTDDEAESSRKPFIKPELRRETDLVNGTGTTVSWSGH